MAFQPEMTTMEPGPLIPGRGGHRKPESFQIVQLCYDAAMRFRDRHVRPGSRPRAQMARTVLKQAEPLCAEWV